MTLSTMDHRNNHHLTSSPAGTACPAYSRARKSQGVATEVPPLWDEDLHTLSWRGEIVKHFRSEAPHQEAVLKAFQAEKWCASIVLPETVAGEVLGKDSLRNTIRNLNRSVRPYVHFRLEGNGSRVCWEGNWPKAHFGHARTRRKSGEVSRPHFA
jgi:hypothetical protein